MVRNGVYWSFLPSELNKDIALQITVRLSVSIAVIRQETPASILSLHSDAPSTNIKQATSSILTPSSWYTSPASEEKLINDSVSLGVRG